METEKGTALKRGFARRMLPYAVALSLLGAAGAGAHYYFTEKTDQLSRTLKRIEGQNAYLQRQLILAQQQLRESDERVHEQEGALAKKVQEHNTALAARVREHEAGLTERVQKHEAVLAEKVDKHEAALSERVRQLSGQVDSFGATMAVITTEHQRLRSAHAAIEDEARKYHAKAEDSLSQLIDDANRLVFEPEKHYALLTPSGLSVYPIVNRTEGNVHSERDKSLRKMHHISYSINDDVDLSASLTDILISLSHSAQRPATQRGKIIVHPGRTFGRVAELVDKEQEDYVARLLDAARRDTPPFPRSDKAPLFVRQLVATFNQLAYASFITEEAHDSVLSFLRYAEEPEEFLGSRQQIFMPHEALAVVGAETLCSVHRDDARAVFTAFFDVISDQQALGLGHYNNFGGSSFAQRAASLATLSRKELADVAAKALETYKVK